MQILGISGSLRAKSLNSALIRAAAKIAPQGVEISLYDLNDLPMYNGDLEAQGVPASVKELRQAIQQADALLFACPEYNYSVTGALKNALDWASRNYGPENLSPLNGKPAAIMGAGGRYGTVRAQAHLRYILLHNDLKVLGKPELMVPQARLHFDDELNLTNEDSIKGLHLLVESLIAWTEQLRK